MEEGHGGRDNLSFVTSEVAGPSVLQHMSCKVLCRMAGVMLIYFPSLACGAVFCSRQCILQHLANKPCIYAYFSGN